ncbi:MULTISPECIES: hypothetical protein [Streptomyces]|uniref:hypothetical protein n=1 Tax=Streptomyces TaxID=1883 RepID=UPI00093DBA36|nr:MULTISPECIES: hypothetical protein [unclassified Streptomyces]OKJ15184.1 hypothetical protein AMK20_05400 [Streptomyces sp. TSRI0261]QNQ34597.1 hypothetical protein HYC88_13385 [Streptomyces sp. CB00271]
MEEVREYRALFAVDIVGSSGRGDVALEQIRQVLSAALHASFTRSGVDWDACLRHDLGDGMRVVAPAGTPETSLIHPLVHELTARLRAHNLLAGTPTRIRLRMALHAGSVQVGRGGTVSGRPLEVLARLLDAEPVRAALAQAPEATTALLVSEHFHETAVCEGRPGIEPAAFRRVDVREKEFAGSAWLHVPAYGGTPQAAGSVPDRTSSDPDRTPSGPDRTPSDADRTPSDPDRTPSDADRMAPAPDRTAPAPDAPAGNTKVISKASGHGVIYALGNGTMNIGGESGESGKRGKRGKK